MPRKHLQLNFKTSRTQIRFGRGHARRRPVVALVLLALALSIFACAPVKSPQPESNANSLSAVSYLPALPELNPNSEAWRNEPPFTSKEVSSFVRDLHNIQTMNAQDTVNYLLRDRGWTRERLHYLDTKIALLVTAINSGSLESLSVDGPDYLPPTREEIHAVQEHYPILNNMLKARDQAGN